MLYDVKELSSKLGVSSVTIYSKLKFKDVRPYIVMKEGKSYVMEEGLDLIKHNLKLNQTLNSDDEGNSSSEVESTAPTELISLKDNLIELLQKQVEDLRKERDILRVEKSEEINHLKSQLVVKDNQIATRDKHVENMQVLLKQEQDKSGTMMALPETIKDHDIKLVNSLTEAMRKQRERYDTEEAIRRDRKRGFLSVVFGRK